MLLGCFGDDTPTCGGCDVCGDTGVGTAVMGRGVSLASSSTGRPLAWNKHESTSFIATEVQARRHIESGIHLIDHAAWLLSQSAR